MDPVSISPPPPPPPLQLKELEEEWGKLPAGKATPIRLLRSQQQAQAAAAPTGGGGGGEGGGEEEGGGDDAEEAEIDPFDLADPVDMLSQMPKDFHEKIVSCLQEFWTEVGVLLI